MVCHASIVCFFFAFGQKTGPPARARRSAPRSQSAGGRLSSASQGRSVQRPTRCNRTRVVIVAVRASTLGVELGGRPIGASRRSPPPSRGFRVCAQSTHAHERAQTRDLENSRTHRTHTRTTYARTHARTHARRGNPKPPFLSDQHRKWRNGEKSR